MIFIIDFFKIRQSRLLDLHLMTAIHQPYYYDLR